MEFNQYKLYIKYKCYYYYLILYKIIFIIIIIINEFKNSINKNQ